MAYGQDGHLGICFQESFGTSFVDSMDYFPIISESLTENIESLLSEGMQARYEEPDDYPGMQSIEGDIVCEVHPHLVGKLLKGWCGQSSEIGYVGSCYQHLFLPRTSDWHEQRAALPPMTIEVYRDTGSAYLYYDCMVNQLTFEISQGALFKMTASIIGAQFAWGNMSSPSYIPGSYWAWDTASLSLAGSAISDVSQLTWKLNNNLAAKAYLDGNRFAGRILRDGYRTFEVSGTMLLDGDTQVRAYRDRSMQRLLGTFTDPASVMDAHNQLILDIPQMRYTDFPPNLGGAGLVEVGFSATGRFDATSSYAFQATLVNTTPAY